MSTLSESIICFLDEYDLDYGMLVGGYYIPRSMLRKLDLSVARIKKKYQLDLSDVIKYNYMDKECEKLRDLREKIPELRSDIFKLPKDLNMTLIMSFVWKGSKEYRAESWKWSFTNILQRLSFDLEQNYNLLKEKDDYPYLDTVFDWLPDSKIKIMEYLNVYQKAYYEGYRFEQNIVKPLRRFCACPCLVCTSTRVSFALQINDCLVGSTGEFFKWCFTGERDENVNKYFRKYFDNFRKGENGEVVGYGLIVPRNYRDEITEKLHELKLI